MTVEEALKLDSLRDARVVAGRGGLSREVLWAHVIDMPDPAPWVRPGQLLLTTGFAWPSNAAHVRQLIRLLNERGLAAMGLAVPGYLQKFTDAALDEADTLDLPLLEIPFAIPFAQITEELHGTILAEQYKIVERSEHIHRALTRAAAEGSNLNDLARELGELIERSVTFEDPDGKLLAYYVAGGQEDAVRRQTLAAAQSPPEMMAALESTGLWEEIRTSPGPVRIPAMPQIGLSARMACPIRLGAELVGLVWIVEGESKLSELDSRAAEHAALVAALHVAHQRELASMESRLGYASFLSLLQADEDDPQAVERARLLGFEPDGVHRIGMALLSEPLPLTREGFLRRERLASSLRSRLRALGTRPLLTTTLNYVAFLLPEAIDVDAFWRGMNSSNGDSVSLVLGRPHRGTQGARRSYREAQSLVNYRDPKKIRRFEEALVPRVLMGDTGAHEAFIDHLFGPLSKVKGGETLKRVLLALAKNGFNLKQTAESLHIHTNTLRYRLARSLEVLKIDLDDPEVRFQLQLAVRIIDFSNSKEPGG